MTAHGDVDPSRLLSIGTPWFSADAVEWLEHNLSSDDTIVEFGGGRSTVFFLSRCRSVKTLETSPSWCSALLGYLATHPALYRRWQLIHLPVDWSPNWADRASGYWGEHEGSLTYAVAREMERTYLEEAAGAAGSSVLVVDGGLRSHLFVLFAETGVFSRSEIVVIDNTEQKFPGLYFEANPLPGFRRLDFVAGSFDGDVLPLTGGRQITTVFVREDRFDRVVPVDTEHGISWSADGLDGHRAFERSGGVMDEVGRWETRIRRELVEYGLLPPPSGAEAASLAHAVPEVVLES